MQSAEEFMRDFFCARTKEIKSDSERRSVFRRKFFADACRWDSRKGAIERSEAERIESMWKYDSDDSEVRVITREIIPFPRLCYHLKMVGAIWLIQNVDVECMNCSGNAGNTACLACLGKGWLHQEDYRQPMERLGRRRTVGNQ